MARIALIEAEQASPEVKEIYEHVLRGKPGNVQKALAQRPEMMKQFLNFLRQRRPLARPQAV